MSVASDSTNAQKTADSISKFVNSYGNNIEDLITCMAGDHRTLQQRFTQIAVMWLEQCAKNYEEGRYDLRNEASAQLGKKFVETISKAERAMPHF